MFLVMTSTINISSANYDYIYRGKRDLGPILVSEGEKEIKWCCLTL